MTLYRAIWALLGLVVLVLGGLFWLHLHDTRVRETAEAHVTIKAKDDTIHTLKGAIVSLGRALKAADSAWDAATGRVIRVAYTPQAVRDSLAVLTRTVAEAEARGDTAVPIATAKQLDAQLRVCRRQVDTIAAAVWGMAQDCEKRVSARDSIIAAQREVARLQEDKIAQLTALPRITTPRLTPYVAANYSPLVTKRIDMEGGVGLRVVGGLLLTAAARWRDSLDVVVGGRWEFK